MSERLKNALLILASACIGYTGFITVPRAAALILAVPVLWTLAPDRFTAFSVILAYKLAASRGLLTGAAVFLPEDHTLAQAAMLYFLLSFGVSLPFLLFWDREPELKAIGVVTAFFLAYVLPPLSLIGVINPLMASGTIFRGWGFAGMITVLGIYSACAFSRKAAAVFLAVTAVFAVFPDRSWYEAPKPEGIIAIDTSFGRLGSGSFNFARDYERAGMVFSGLKERGVKDMDGKVIVLPETIAGRLNKYGVELWRGEIQKTAGDGRAVMFGAELPAGDGRKYDNALLMAYLGEITYTRQRIPVPYSMYRGLFAKTGANLHLWECGILPLPDGRKAAIIVCYEAFLTWPCIASMTQRPDMIIAIANLWWCKDTSLPRAHRTSVLLWSLLFGIPAVSARNI
jgi:hypothetical protein